MSSASGRRYLVGSWADLEALATTGELPTGPEVTPEDDSEDAEYDALMEAAAQSARAQPAGARRVVIVVEDDQVMALHVDVSSGAEPDDDLAWFAWQELDDLVRG